MSVEAGRLAALERIVRNVAADVEAVGFMVGFMVGAGAAPLPWYAHMDVDGSLALGEHDAERLAAWHAEVLPDGFVAGNGLDALVEARMVTPTCGYLLVQRVHPDGAVQTEWVARDDLPPWPL